ncbi:MAG: PEP-CTERM sorting domain-containing protein [Rivularia sp. (in: cyanobacteria)]
MISNLKTLLKSVALIPVATVLFSGSAQAALIGDTVNGQLSITGGPTILNQNAVVTDPGVEFTVVGNQNASISLDVKDDAFDIIYNLTTISQIGFPSTWTLSDLDFDFAGTPGRITGVTLASGNSNRVNNISFTNDSISVDFPDIVNPPQVQTFSFDIDAEPVPEPITLLGTGAALGFGVLLKKKKGAKSA